MGSRKRSARRREIAAFESELGSLDFGDAFDRERRRNEDLAEDREEARRVKACDRKMRYGSRAEAEEAIALSAEHGRRGLSYYRCPYCHNWHLTSHPWN